MPTTTNNAVSGFCFFTDAALLNAQTSTENYGPTTSAGGNDCFRTTSIHTATSNPKAYAISSGQVFIQETTNPISGGPELVNLLIKPSKQPVFDIGYIKYFIYRGILKSSLIDTTGTQIAPATNNDLTNIVWEAQIKKNISIDKRAGNAPGTTNTPAPIEALGLQFSAGAADAENNKEDTDFLEDFFFREDATNQIPSVKAGWNLGDFQGASFGLEIVVERMGFEPTFGLLRQFEHIIEVPILSGSATLADEMIHFNQKEKILSFIDPAAFFGSFYGYELFFKDAAGVPSILTGDNIYDNCLINFLNKNTVYLDIRNHLNYSIDYFRSYGRDIKLSTDNQAAPSIINYYASGWPLMALTTFVANSGTPAATQNTIRLQFPKGNNDMPALHLVNARTSAVFPKYLKEIDRFGTFYLNETSGFLDMEVVLVSPKHATGGVAIASYIKLQYFNRINVNLPKESHNTTLEVDKYYDHLFQPFNFNIPWETTEGVSSKVYKEPLYVDIFTNRGVEFMANVGVAKDSDNNVVFFAFSVDKVVAHSTVRHVSPNFISQKESNTTISQFIEKIAEKLNKTVEYYSVDDSGQTYSIKHLQDIEETALDSNTCTAKDIIYIDLTSTEMQELDTLKTTNLLLEDFPITLSFKYVTSAVPEFATKYELFLEGFQTLSSSPHIQVVQIPTGIYKYKIVEEIDFLIHPIMKTNSHKAANLPLA